MCFCLFLLLFVCFKNGLGLVLVILVLQFKLVYFNYLFKISFLNLTVFDLVSNNNTGYMMLIFVFDFVLAGLFVGRSRLLSYEQAVWGDGSASG